MGDYRKLEVWQLANQLSDRVVLVVDKLPARVRAAKGEQMTTAADAIHDNIAEGCGLNTDRQLARHLRIALGSANELENQLATLNRRGHLDESDQDLIALARRVCAMLAKFIDRIDPPGRSRRKAG
jgi:four helix bundle protein